MYRTRARQVVHDRDVEQRPVVPRLGPAACVTAGPGASRQAAELVWEVISDRKGGYTINNGMGRHPALHRTVYDTVQKYNR